MAIFGISDPCAQNAADHAAHRSARNSTRDAAHDARRRHGWRRSLIFLNHFYLLRNLGRRAQFAVHDIGLDLFDDAERPRLLAVEVVEAVGGPPEGIIICPLGKASVKISGIRTMTPMIMIWMATKRSKSIPAWFSACRRTR